jgi:hypothetical protein
LFSPPLNFYSVYYKINSEEKDKMLAEAGFRALRNRNQFLEEQVRYQEEDLKLMGKEIRVLLGEKDEAIRKAEQLEVCTLY